MSYGMQVIEKLDDGMVRDTSRINLAPSQLAEAMNMYRDQAGDIRNRKGWKYISSCSATGPHELVTFHKIDGTQELLLINQGGLYVYTGTASATFATAWGAAPVTNSSGVFSGAASGRVGSFEYKGHIYFNVYGTGNWYKYNGTKFTKAGVVKPATPTLTGSTSSGALPAGTYYHGYYLKNSNGTKGTVSTATATTIAGTGQVTFSNFSLTSGGVNDYTHAGFCRGVVGSEVMQLIEEVALTGTPLTTYVDAGAVTDANLGALAPTDNGVPPTGVIDCIMFKDRAHAGVDLTSVAADDADQVYHSSPFNPETWPVADVTEWAKGGERLRDIIVQGDQLFMARTDSIAILRIPETTDTTSWSKAETTSQYGVSAPFATAGFGNYSLAWGYQGFIALGPEGIQSASLRLAFESIQSDLLTEDILDTEMSLVTSTRYNFFSAINFKNRVWVSLREDGSIFAGPQAGTSNNLIWCFDHKKRSRSTSQLGAFFPLSAAVGGINSFAIYNNGLYGVSQSASKVFQLEQHNNCWDEATIAGATKGDIAWGAMFYTFQGQPGHENDEKISSFITTQAIRRDNNAAAPFYVYYFPDVQGTGFVTTPTFVTTNSTFYTHSATYNSDQVPEDFIASCNEKSRGRRHLIVVTNREPVGGAYSPCSLTINRITWDYETVGAWHA